MNEMTSKLGFQNEDHNEKHKIEAICDNKVHAKELNSDYLLSLYYLVLWNDYAKERNFWETALTI